MSFRPLGLLTALALLGWLISLPAPAGAHSFGNPRPVPQFGLFYAGISGSENERPFDVTQDIVTDTIGTIHCTAGWRRVRLHGPDGAVNRHLKGRS